MGFFLKEKYQFRWCMEKYKQFIHTLYLNKINMWKLKYIIFTKILENINRKTCQQYAVRPFNNIDGKKKNFLNINSDTDW